MEAEAREPRSLTLEVSILLKSKGLLFDIIPLHLLFCIDMHSQKPHLGHGRAGVMSQMIW